jgi:glycosyltransferase involved in cell wall biosynthesis
LEEAEHKSSSIVFVLPSLSAGGAERIFINVANGISDSAKVYIAEIQKGGSLNELVKDNVARLNLSNKYLWLFRIIWYVYKIKPCCLVATNFDVNASLLAIKWLLPKSCALVVREPVSIYATQSESKVPIIRYLIFKYLYRYASTLVLLSNEMRDEFIQLCPKIASKIKVVYNGVSSSRLENISDEEDDSGYQNYIITVCRLEHQKGLDVLIAAFAKVQEKYPDYKLLLVGKGSQNEKLREQIKTCNMEKSVKLVGFVENPLSLVMGAKLFVLSSRYEGMSNSMLEALCLGVPVVAVRKHTAAAEVIRENVTGFLVNECSVQALGDVLLRALTEIESLNREQISQWACSKFSLTKMIDNYQDVFGEYCEIQSKYL